MWEGEDIPVGAERGREFTGQLPDASADVIQVHLELDAEGPSRPLRSREVEVAR